MIKSLLNGAFSHTRYIVTDSAAAFDVCSATLVYHVLCRHKHADVFEAQAVREAMCRAAAPGCGEDAVRLRWPNCCLYWGLSVIYYAGSSSVLESELNPPQQLVFSNFCSFSRGPGEKYIF